MKSRWLIFQYITDLIHSTRRSTVGWTSEAIATEILSIIERELPMDGLWDKTTLPELSKDGGKRNIWSGNYEEDKRAFDISFIERALQLNGGNISKAIRTSGINKSSMLRKIKKYKIDTEKFKRESAKWL